MVNCNFHLRLLFRYSINESRASKKEKKKCYEYLDAWDDWCILKDRADVWTTFPVVIVLMPLAIPRHFYLDAKANKAFKKMMKLGENLSGELKEIANVS